MSDTTQTTSKEQYEAAQQAYVKAYLARADAKAAMAAAEQAMYAADDALDEAGRELAMHEEAPGIPAYLASRP